MRHRMGNIASADFVDPSGGLPNTESMRLMGQMFNIGITDTNAGHSVDKGDGSRGSAIVSDYLFYFLSHFDVARKRKAMSDDGGFKGYYWLMSMDGMFDFFGDAELCGVEVGGGGKVSLR